MRRRYRHPVLAKRKSTRSTAAGNKILTDARATRRHDSRTARAAWDAVNA